MNILIETASGKTYERNVDSSQELSYTLETFQSNNRVYFNQKFIEGLGTVRQLSISLIQVPDQWAAFFDSYKNL